MEYLLILIFCLIILFLVTLRKIVLTNDNNIMSYNSETIANYFIKKHSEYGELTPMKLIKLVYIAYGWYLTTFDNKRLLSEQPQAWRYGPVFPTLYNSLRSFGRNFVKEPISTYKSETINKDDAEFLDKIWSIYGEKDGIYLSALTHKEGTPWSLAYPRGENVVIPDELIKEHYSKLS